MKGNGFVCSLGLNWEEKCSQFISILPVEMLQFLVKRKQNPGGETVFVLGYQNTGGKPFFGESYFFERGDCTIF